MKSLRVSISAAVALVFVLSGISAPAHGEPVVNPVTQWNLIAMNTLVQIPAPAGGAPPALQINMGMTQGAVYDAVNAITPKHHRPYLLRRRFSAKASREAAVATAAYLVLSDIVSTVPAEHRVPEQGSVVAVARRAIRRVARGVPDTSFKEQGIAAGNAAADAMIAAREDDGRFGPSQWDAERGSGALAAAVAERDIAARPDSVGRRSGPVPAARALRSSAPPAPTLDERRLRG